jgi:hypothetical protein
MLCLLFGRDISSRQPGRHPGRNPDSNRREPTHRQLQTNAPGAAKRSLTRTFTFELPDPIEYKPSYGAK